MVSLTPLYSGLVFYRTAISDIEQLSVAGGTLICPMSDAGVAIRLSFIIRNLLVRPSDHTQPQLPIVTC
jgi:hypothetical protein